MIEKLKGHIPDSVYQELPRIIKEFKIDTPLRMAHFLSQTAHESGEFKRFVENLNYSEESLKKIFSKYFPGNLAKSYARNPQKIANRVYANRMGNGSEESGDGWKYRGRGAIQVTFKNNYKALGNYLGVDLINNPDLVTSKYILTSAAWFFKENDLFSLCEDATKDTVIKLTQRINGGQNGIEHRWSLFNKFYKILS